MASLMHSAKYSKKEIILSSQTLSENKSRNYTFPHTVVWYYNLEKTRARIFQENLNNATFTG